MPTNKKVKKVKGWAIIQPISGIVNSHSRLGSMWIYANKKSAVDDSLMLTGDIEIVPCTITYPPLPLYK